MLQIIDGTGLLFVGDSKMSALATRAHIHRLEQHYLCPLAQTGETAKEMRPGTIAHAIDAFLENRSKYDSLFSVTRWQTRLYDQSGRALNHDPSRLLQTQDLPPVFEENSCLYLFTRSSLIRRHHRIGDRPYMFEIDVAEAWDIDDNLDFAICEFLMTRAGAAGQKP